MIFFIWWNSISTLAAWRLTVDYGENCNLGFLWGHFPAVGFAFAQPRQTKHFHLSLPTAMPGSQGGQVCRTQEDFAEKIMIPREQHCEDVQPHSLSTAPCCKLYLLDLNFSTQMLVISTERKSKGNSFHVQRQLTPKALTYVNSSKETGPSANS